ncbi:MAG: DNA polymerase I, thermostable [Myxococcota bacterium]|nr:DNA polymerase I, thermostable [Myxococcota bacterium]
MRILAEASGDEGFIEVFRRGDDLHSVVATRMFGKPVSKHENVHLRNSAKAINFGLAYGMGAAGLARQLEVPLEEARRLMESHFRAFPRLRDYMEESAREALRRGYARTLAGRRLYFDPRAREPSQRAALERVAKNMPIQGTNADIIKIALHRLRTAFHQNQSSALLVNTIHDEIVVECEESGAGEIAGMVRREMQEAGGELVRAVPMAADVVIADSWE